MTQLPDPNWGDWRQLLEPDETVLAWAVVDLDRELHYHESLVVLTNRQVIHVPRRPEPDAGPAELTRIQQWPLAEIENVNFRDRGGVGILELLGPTERFAYWYYTARQAAGIRRLVHRFDAERMGTAGEEEWDEEAARPAPVVAPPPSAKSLFRLLRFARPRAGLILLGLTLSVLATFAGLIPPYLTMPLMDDILVPYQNEISQIRKDPNLTQSQRREQYVQTRKDFGPRFQWVVWYLLGLGGAAVAAWLLGWGQGVVMARVSERISADLRNHTYGHLHKLSLDFFGGKRTGDLISRVSTDTERICNFLADNLVDFISDVLMIVGTATVLLYIDPLLTVATLCPFPLIGWFIYRARSQLQTGFQRGGRAWGAMTSVLADTIPGIRVVKAFAQEQREIDRFKKANDRIIEANDRVNTVWTFFWPMVTFLNQLGLLVVWAFGAWRVYDFQITVGVLSAFLGYIGRFYLRLESMSRMFSATQRAAASAQRIFEILDRTPSVPEPANPVHIENLTGEIEIRNVSFRYATRPILEDVSIKIRPGEMIGLVGPSGSGKSTLVNLVCRFYDVSEGAIFVDGVDVRAYPVSELRRHIGMVLQEPFLFFGTIAENIAYGRPEASREEIIAAARATHAHEFILRLPDGYDSVVGERGQGLSGGERQRISIARAILIDPRILILDEATSAVDTETEREIQAALDNLIQGRTTIAIAHRLSTLQKADRLIVLERGQIVESGQHFELLQNRGVYARLHRAQAPLEELVGEEN
ncbi:MAG TPA: ABC transporter ATP-binding protein [Planctomycetaceae bacterium]|nr:ABC transporter ATP-binding protein [Planctomycetaceae bacterium]